jgi:16S rRNA G966 N2-methylase RsmD
MITSWAHTPIQRQIIARIEKLTHVESDYWSFRNNAQRCGVHAIFRYPAMMVPTMQAKLLEIVREGRSDMNRVLDPFVGSGTMLTEAMAQGLDFTGFDINPLAILACKVKAGPFSTNRIAMHTVELLSRIDSDKRTAFEISFAGQSKWFTKGASIGLSRIRRAIQNVDDIWLRRFYWLCMAETIRHCSNSRTSTYKLHIRPDVDTTASMSSVLEAFSGTVKSNVLKVLSHYLSLQEEGLLCSQGQYRGHVELKLQDSSKIDSNKSNKKFDLLFTSPPYGDNSTTITYGQFSYLSLNWIPLADIDISIPLDINKNTHSIDSASMGGSVRGAEQKAEFLFGKSGSFREIYRALARDNPSGAKRLSSFCFDLHNSVESVTGVMSKKGYMVWTLGNRTIAGKRVPLDEIVFEFLESYEVSRVAKFSRPILSKRMATRNNCSDTIHDEIVVIASS